MVHRTHKCCYERGRCEFTTTKLSVHGGGLVFGKTAARIRSGTTVSDSPRGRGAVIDNTRREGPDRSEPSDLRRVPVGITRTALDLMPSWFTGVFGIATGAFRSGTTAYRSENCVPGRERSADARNADGIERVAVRETLLG